jgi:phospholipid/cholesterol/gamma-HCH transport system substrate-binding protein
MARESLGTKVRRRALGIGYLVIVAGLLLLSIAFYNKVFTDVVKVSLKTDHTGNSLREASDVKVRGLIVGAVDSVKVDSGPNRGCVNEQVACVTVTLALQPDKVKLIPDNVSAQILPKTIFGEQYVNLELPDKHGPAIKAGDQISQDRSQGALETAKVLGDLLPLLQAVKPAQLNATLTAMATALQGRGEELGHTLAHLDSYLQQMNPHTQQLIDDLSRLGKFSDLFNQVAPDLLATLDNLQTTSRTIIAQKSGLDDLFTAGADTSSVLRSFLSDNEQNMITLVDTSKQVYGLLEEYSPEFTCLFGGLNNLQKLANTIIHENQINLRIVIDTSGVGTKEHGSPKYVQGEEPRFITGYGPNCFGLPDNPQPVDGNGNFQIPAQYRCINDGAALTDDPCSQRGGANASTTALGSPSENSLVNTLIAGSLHTTPDKVPGIATMLAAPLYRGAQVVVK